MFPEKVTAFIRVLIDGNIVIKIKIFFVCIPWIGHRLLLSRSHFCRLLRCHKCLPFLVVQPCLCAQLLARIHRFYMTAQCELFYGCYYHEISNAIVQIELYDFTVLMYHLPDH